MAPGEGIIMPGESLDEFEALLAEVRQLVPLQGRLGDLFAAMVTGDLWVAQRHIAPVAAHARAQTAGPPSEARRAALAEVEERSKLRALCLKSARETLAASDTFAGGVEHVLRHSRAA